MSLLLALAGRQAAPAIPSRPAGGDDAPGKGPREVRPVIYLWPERKEEALEAIEAVEQASEAPEGGSRQAVADLRAAIEQEAAAAVIRDRLAIAEAALVAIDAAIIDAHQRALFEDMRQAAIAAALAREQFEMEVAIALCLLA